MTLGVATRMQARAGRISGVARKTLEERVADGELTVQRHHRGHFANLQLQGLRSDGELAIESGPVVAFHCGISNQTSVLGPLSWMPVVAESAESHVHLTGVISAGTLPYERCLLPATSYRLLLGTNNFGKLQMKYASMLNRKAEPESPERRVIHRTRGAAHGPVTRLFGPRDLGDLIKPFVLLDHFDLTPQADPPRFPIHPHSGIATLTLVLSGNVSYEDTTGKSGVLHAGSLEWMRAGAGVWHAAEMADRERLHGFQLWIALPSELEEAPSESQYIVARDVPQNGPARVALGRSGNARSAIRAPESMNYLDVRLKQAERWRYDPPAGHDVAWVFVYEGELVRPDTITTGELVVFDESTAPVEFLAAGDTKFLLGSAVKHPHDLVLGYYSIHTSEQRLKRGAVEIQRVGEELRAAGKIDDAYLEVAVERIRVGNW